MLTVAVFIQKFGFQLFNLVHVNIFGGDVVIILIIGSRHTIIIFLSRMFASSSAWLILVGLVLLRSVCRVNKMGLTFRLTITGAITLYILLFDWLIIIKKLHLFGVNVNVAKMKKLKI